MSPGPRPSAPFATAELQSILTLARADLESLRGARVLVTGGTGFFGQWLLAALGEANAKAGLGARLTLLTREPARFAHTHPHLAGAPHLSLVEGSVERLMGSPAWEALSRQGFTHVVHLATEGLTAPTLAHPTRAIGVIADGTRQTLELARACGARRFLFTSSGSVYARKHATSPITESFSHASDTMEVGDVYAISGNAKRQGESFCAAYHAEFGLETVVARCFAFLGPALPMDGKFAAGNFIRDALRRTPIVIQGDGTPVRSYLHPVDLTAWLCALLARGGAGQAYNVGSAEAIGLKALAERVTTLLHPEGTVEVRGSAVPGARPDYYVPDVEKITRALGVRETVGLDQAIRSTAEWWAAPWA